jgi:hypothetical protein
LGISTHILSQWEKKKENNENEKDNLQGRARKFNDEQIAFIAALFKAYTESRKKIRMKAFVKHLHKEWKKKSWLTAVPSRKTVEDILFANDLWKPKIMSNKQKGSYKASITKYAPHIQSVLDGKQVVVNLNDESCLFTMEFSKDMATDAICGYAIGKSETAELVKEAFDNHSERYQKPKAALIDNGKGNLKAAIDLGAEGTLFIKAMPHRPQTKGQIEGEFGIFERTVSILNIDNSDNESLAFSLVKIIAETYLRLRNNSPRCSVCPFTPAKLMKSELNKECVDNAWQELTAERQRKQENAEKRAQRDEEFNYLINSIVEEHRLKGKIHIMKKSLKNIEKSVLKEAEQNFSVYSMRDNFDGSKRTMAYFCGISRKLQQKNDQMRKKLIAQKRYSLDYEFRQEREKLENELSIAREKQQLEQHPEQVIIESLIIRQNLSKSLRRVVKYWERNIDKAFIIIKRKVNSKQKILINLIYEKIMALSQYTIETRYELLKFIEEKAKQHQIKYSW